MAFITIDYLKEQGFRIPDSSIAANVTTLNALIDSVELAYMQNTIGYDLTAQLYALVDPLPAEVDIFLNGNLVDGEEFYAGILYEIAFFIMANYYAGLGINVNNSGFSSPIADGERTISANFMVTDYVNTTRNQRVYTAEWLESHNMDFFSTWLCTYFNELQATSVW